MLCRHGRLHDEPRQELTRAEPLFRFFIFCLLLKFGKELNTVDDTLTFANKRDGFDFEPISTVSSWSV